MLEWCEGVKLGWRTPRSAEPIGGLIHNNDIVSRSCIILSSPMIEEILNFAFELSIDRK